MPRPPPAAASKPVEIAPGTSPRDGLRLSGRGMPRPYGTAERRAESSASVGRGSNHGKPRLAGIRVVRGRGAGEASAFRWMMARRAGFGAGSGAERARHASPLRDFAPSGEVSRGTMFRPDEACLAPTGHWALGTGHWALGTGHYPRIR